MRPLAYRQQCTLVVWNPGSALPRLPRNKRNACCRWLIGTRKGDWRRKKLSSFLSGQRSRNLAARKILVFKPKLKASNHSPI